MIEDRIAIMADIHGEHRVLNRVLSACREAGVQRIILLGDLFDRLDQIDDCLSSLSGWPVDGVLGNHEQEALKHEADHHSISEQGRETLVERLADRFMLDDALFIHDHLELRTEPTSSSWKPHVVFAGHTHYRHASDDSGPLDISLGHICLREGRQYLINPGAVVEGQFAIWERYASRVLFERV